MVSLWVNIGFLLFGFYLWNFRINIPFDNSWITCTKPAGTVWPVAPPHASNHPWTMLWPRRLELHEKRFINRKQSDLRCWIRDGYIKNRGFLIPWGSIHGIFPYISHKNQPNVSNVHLQMVVLMIGASLLVQVVAIQIFFIFDQYWGKISHLTSIFFRWVETTNQLSYIQIWGGWIEFLFDTVDGSENPGSTSWPTEGTAVFYPLFTGF